MKHRISWGTLFVIACAAIYFLTRTTDQLPLMVASHFDAGGFPTAFMPRARYFRFVLTLGIAVPLALVALLTAVYSRAADMKLPNRDYWLAPERIGQTRGFLVAHGIWFGSLLISFETRLTSTPANSATWRNVTGRRDVFSPVIDGPSVFG